ncbi:Uu.00g119440.m01.CDS01 [Anthostomella pinea]|uniref:Uu.00g119440.m01.CDS01 n=1 Tax=Anthostomella pinea TaxID=933095 RepID=A0AAI8VGM3_9PEZI|nr:Uu.00g119440.m01.CDS01 [Anthostomella pinea]
MFRFHKPVDIVTLFHKPSSQASVRVATLLKQVSANATEVATEDQASDHSHQTHPHRQRQEFDLNITEDPPTADQLQTILEYVGKSKISSIIQGASTEKDALKKFKESADNFKRPVIVDWNNGKAVASDKESEILKVLEQVESKE